MLPLYIGVPLPVDKICIKSSSNEASPKVFGHEPPAGPGLMFSNSGQKPVC